MTDLYDVLGQAVRSARWTHPLALMRELERRVRERPNIEIAQDPDGAAREKLAEWAERGLNLALTIWVVQPGISRSGVYPWREGQALISAARDWCQDQNASLRLAISA